MDNLHRFDYEHAISVLSVISDSVDTTLRDCVAIYSDMEAQHIQEKLTDTIDLLMRHLEEYI